MRAFLQKVGFGLAFLLLLPFPARANLTGPQKILMLRVYFHDFPNKTRFTAAEVDTFAGNLETLWRAHTSYTISLSFPPAQQ
jgi:hypothetical protein